MYSAGCFNTDSHFINCKAIVCHSLPVAQAKQLFIVFHFLCLPGFVIYCLIDRPLPVCLLCLWSLVWYHCLVFIINVLRAHLHSLCSLPS